MDGHKLTAEILDGLAAFFEPKTISWKPQSVTKDKTRALAVAYIDARDVMRRLDLVAAGDWEFRWEPDGNNVHGMLTVCGVTREDVGEWSESAQDQGKTRKAAVSDALKRCAVQFGVGRYLYYLPARWVAYDEDHKRFAEEPQLPAWALPGNEPKMAPTGPAIAVDEETGEVREAEVKPVVPTTTSQGGDGNGGGKTTTAKPLTRPYDPKTLKERMPLQVAQRGGAAPGDSAKQGLVAGALNALFEIGGDSRDVATEKRHMLLEHLTGNQSTKALSVGWINALIYWSRIQDTDGQWVPHPMAIDEAALVVEGAQAERQAESDGVEELPL